MNKVKAGKYAGSALSRTTSGIAVDIGVKFGFNFSSGGKVFRFILSLVIVLVGGILLLVANAEPIGDSPSFPIIPGIIIVVLGLAFMLIHITKLQLNSKNVEAVEEITSESTKSAASGVARGIVGGALLGPVGMLAGAMSAKNKSVHHIAVQWRNGERSLLEVDGEIYKAIITDSFS